MASFVSYYTVCTAHFSCRFKGNIKSWVLLWLPLSGASDEADEGAAGEEQNGRIPKEPRDRHTQEGPTQTRGAWWETNMDAAGMSLEESQCCFSDVWFSLLQHQLKLLEAQKRQQELILRRKTEEVRNSLQAHYFWFTFSFFYSLPHLYLFNKTIKSC